MAIAGKNTDPERFIADIPLWRVVWPGDLGARFPGEEGHAPRRCAACIHDRLRDLFGRGKGAGHKDPGTAGIDRLKLVGLAEPVFIQFDLHVLCQGDGLGWRLAAHRQNHHVERLAPQDTLLVLVMEDQVVGIGILLDLRDTRARVLYPPQVLGLVKVGGVLLAEGALVHDKDFALDAGQAFLGQDRFLGGIHAADRRAVGMLLISRADALQPGDPLGDLAIGWALDDALRGAGAAGQALKLQAGDDVGIAPVAQLFRR